MMRELRTGAIALAGVALFAALGLPLPFLLGPLFACLIAALAGADLCVRPRLSEGMRTILGVAVGASVTPALVAMLPSMVGSLALVPLLILAIGMVGYPLFRHGFGFDPATSYYAAMPGGLQDMLVFGEEAGGDVRALSLIHATRVLIIVTILPVLLASVFGADLSNPPGLPALAVPPHEMVLMVILALVGWQGAKAVGLFGASILGPMLLAAMASLTDLLHGRPPAEAIYLAQFFIGVTVGAKYVGVTVPELRRDVAAGTGYTLAILVVAAVFAWAAMGLGVPPKEALLAFSPGGQAEMAVLALVAGADVAFVVAHHLVRLVVVIVGAPLVSVRLMGGGGG